VIAEKVVMAFSEFCGFDTADGTRNARINVFRACQIPGLRILLRSTIRESNSFTNGLAQLFRFIKSPQAHAFDGGSEGVSTTAVRFMINLIKSN
jgi:hypothetical protein